MSDEEMILINIMVDYGDLIRLPGGEYLEDTGGHVIHESQAVSYIKPWLESLSKEERKAVLTELKKEMEA